LKGAADERRVVVAAALVLPMVWLVHGSIDWLWEFPALSCPALVALGLAVALGRSPQTQGSPASEVTVFPG